MAIEHTLVKPANVIGGILDAHFDKGPSFATAVAEQVAEALTDTGHLVTVPDPTQPGHLGYGTGTMIFTVRDRFGLVYRTTDKDGWETESDDTRYRWALHQWAMRRNRYAHESDRASVTIAAEVELSPSLMHLEGLAERYGVRTGEPGGLGAALDAAVEYLTVKTEPRD